MRTIWPCPKCKTPLTVGLGFPTHCSRCDYVENEKPVRLQRKRTKGFKLVSPNGLPIVYVGRPSRWGNPFWGLDKGKFNREWAVNEYRKHIEEGDKYGEAIGQGPQSSNQIRLHLHGKNLACWCPLDQPCHADVLLEIANQE